MTIWKKPAKFIATVILALGFAGSAAHSQSPSRRHEALHFEINFSQQFALTSCPANAPVNDGCLNVTLSADVPELGGVGVQRLVLFNWSLFDPNHPTCVPDETSGTMTLADGTITFHAPGNVCFNDGTATYGLIVTGGTGRYADAIGGGQITVPPPQTGSTGRELWNFSLYLK